MHATPPGGIPIPIQPGNGPKVLFLVSCRGKETNLTKCAEAAADPRTSQTPHAVGVLCKGDWNRGRGTLLVTLSGEGAHCWSCCQGEGHIASYVVRGGAHCWSCCHLFDSIFVVNASCQDGDLRLVGGVGPREGQVEVCYNGMWGHICNPIWSYANAAVVCRQLGYSPAGK